MRRSRSLVKPDNAEGVLLPEGETGSSFFHGILQGAVDHFPDELRLAKLPKDARIFKRTYGDAVVRFESARLGSARRVEIARHLSRSTAASLRLSEGGQKAPLAEALETAVAAPAVETRVLRGKVGLRAEVPLEGVVHAGRDILPLLDRLYAAHHLTGAARDGVRWIVEHIADAGGTLDLSDHRFAILGAAAELSPAPLLLAAGATVLWVDVTSPDSFLARFPELAGTIVHAPLGDDLLGKPRSVAASLRRFAQAGPVHVGLFAYAPGASRELRIAAVMTELVRSVGPEVVKSVSLFISPTSPGELQSDDAAVVEERLRTPKGWQRALEIVHALPKPGYHGDGVSAVSRAVMEMQGPGYQAAQYLAKIIAAEVLATDGLGGDEDRASPISVSANVAGITNTRSLAHPLFQLGFVGAPLFGVRIFEPDTTRALSGLLMLHDLLNPAAPGHAERAFETPRDRARAVRSEQVHGGVYDMPWIFEPTVRAAAIIGMTRRPSLLWQRAPKALLGHGHVLFVDDRLPAQTSRGARRVVVAKSKLGPHLRKDAGAGQALLVPHGDERRARSLLDGRGDLSLRPPSCVRDEGSATCDEGHEHVGRVETKRQLVQGGARLACGQERGGYHRAGDRAPGGQGRAGDAVLDGPPQRGSLAGLADREHQRRPCPGRTDPPQRGDGARPACLARVRGERAGGRERAAPQNRAETLARAAVREHRRDETQRREPAHRQRQACAPHGAHSWTTWDLSAGSRTTGAKQFLMSSAATRLSISAGTMTLVTKASYCAEVILSPVWATFMSPPS